MKSIRAVLSISLSLLLMAGCTQRAPVQEDVPAATAEPIVVTQGASQSAADDAFSILFVNVGRADAAVLRFGERVILIDTGTKASAPQLIAGLNLLHASRIDAVFVTHSHADHLGGLAALAANYEIARVYYPKLTEPNKDGVSKIAARCEKLSLPHTTLTAGESVTVAEGVAFDVLAPLVYNADDDNDNSLVLRFSYDGKTFLFTGDMQFAEEETLLKTSAALKADLLKVGNHGNPDATSEAFGAAVSPSLAIVSTDTREDDNSANPRVRAALLGAEWHVTQDDPIGVLITMQDGAFVVSSPDGASALPTIEIAALSVSEQTITLRNTGSAPCDLSGCVVYCDRSDASKRIPDGVILDSGAVLRISADGGTGELVFRGEDKPLNVKKENVVSLYGALGTLLSEKKG